MSPPVSIISFLPNPQRRSARVSSGVQGRWCPCSLPPGPRHSFTHPPMFPSWEPFVFLVSAAMIWDNVRGHWSRQGSIGVSILPLLALGSIFPSSAGVIKRLVLMGFGSIHCFLHRLVCVSVRMNNLFVGVVCGLGLSRHLPTLFSAAAG